MDGRNHKMNVHSQLFPYVDTCISVYSNVHFSTESTLFHYQVQLPHDGKDMYQPAKQIHTTLFAKAGTGVKNLFKDAAGYFWISPHNVILQNASFIN